MIVNSAGQGAPIISEGRSHDQDVADGRPQGWRLVPEEPTHEMIAAIPRSHYAAGCEADVWRRMLSAAPTQPEEAR